LHFDFINPSGNHVNPLPQYHWDSYSTLNENPLFIYDNGVFVYNDDFCLREAKEYRYYRTRDRD